MYVVHLFTKDFNSVYEKPIVGDAKAYYAYLPAIFIYGDSQFNFINNYEEKHYANNQRKDFLNTTQNGKKVNKTFPGVAILYAPFFLIAHALALLFGYDTDGYSIIYQYLFDFGYWFYVLLGAIFFTKVFRLLNFKNKHINISLFALLIGTNILFYSVIDQSVTHLFNFALINAFFYHLLQFKLKFLNKNQLNLSYQKHIYYAYALLILIGIVRPTNIIVLMLMPIFFNDIVFYKNLTTVILKFKIAFVLILFTIIIGSIPFVLWYWQTGEWVVYSYGDEGFDFTKPEWQSFLFSYMKGWFTYTPLALVIIIFGLYYSFKNNVYKTFLIIMFYAVSIYIFSSWWCWYYGAGMSQRVMIDYYLLLGYLLILILNKSKPFIKTIFLVLLVLCTILNVIQTIQIKKGIYKMGSPTKTMYWDNFLSLTPKAKIYEKTNWILIEKQKINLENSIIKGQVKAKDSKLFIQTSKNQPYSPTFYVELNKVSSKIVIKFKAFTKNKISESRLVLTTDDKNPQTKVIYIKNFVVKNKNVAMEYLIEFEKPIESFSIYLWNAGTQELVNYSCFEIESYLNKN